MNRPFFLYEEATSLHGRAVPLLSLTLVAAQVQNRDGVQLTFDAAPLPDRAFHCVWMIGAVSDRSMVRRYYGILEIDTRERPASDGPPSPTWLWRLTPEAMEALQAARTPAEGSILLRLELNGVALVNKIPVPIVAEDQFEISAPEWERIQVGLGYEVPPSQERLLSPANLQSSSWQYAARQLSEARNRLAAGEGHDAMQDVLGEFESLHSAPYSEAEWKSMLAALPDQKADGIASLIAGYCTYLNKIGHHRDRKVRGPDGRLEPMPVDQWEAELAVAIGHYILAYARRILDGPPPE